MVLRHMLRNGGILPLSAGETPVGGDPAVFVKDLDRTVRYPHIDHFADI